MTVKNTDKPTELDDQEKEEATQNFFKDRNSLVDSIVEENEEQTRQDEEDMGITPEDDQEGTDLEKKESGEDQDEGETKDLEEDEPKEDMVEIVVYGEKKMVPKSQALEEGIKALQMQSAADKNLEEAKALLKETKKTLKAPKPDADEENGKDEPRLLTPKEIAHALQYGTEDEAAAAIEQLNRTGGSQETFPPEKIKEIVRETVEETTSTEKIATKFEAPVDEGGFGDLAADPYLRKMAIDNVNERIKKGEDPNSWETYEAAGKDVRKWVEKFKDPSEKPSEFDDKKEKKKSIDNVPAASAVKDLKKPKEKGQSASDVIEEMAASRPGRQ